MLKLEALNDAQREAVMHGEGPLLVLAGPGSGKTFTITQRILYLIEVMQVDPSEILVITFTKEAALSMQHRFMEQANQVYPVNFGTFHSVFYQILRNSNSSRIKHIWGESQKKNLIISILKKLNNENCSEKAQSYLHAISLYKNTGDMENSLNKLPQELREQFSDVFESYENIRKKQCAIDFDDMVYECREILCKNEDIRAYWSKKFSHILMDEFQDINPMQYRVIKLLSRSPYNLFAVGDDDQAIYGFRGSKPACMKLFEEEFSARRMLLNINYRSDKEIVEASLRVVTLNKDRFDKKLLPSKERIKDGESCQEKSLILQSFAERAEQYDYLIHELGKIYNRTDMETGAYESCAVLFRTNMYMQGFAVRLNRTGLPFEMKEKGSNIYEHFIVKDIMSYLRIANGEADRALYLQILNKPARTISREALYYGTDDASAFQTDSKFVLKSGIKTPIQSMMAYYERNLGEAGYDNAIYTLSLMEKQLNYIKSMSLYPAVQYICKVIGYEKYLKAFSQKYSNAVERLGEWNEILDFIKAESKEYENLEAWMEAQKQYRDGNSVFLLHQKGTVAEKSAKPIIHLMTVHASKGLEFDKVYIPDCNEKVFPHGSMTDKEICEEECRIFYVAMTRAKKSLELLYLVGTKERPRIPSRFLNPLL